MASKYLPELVRIAKTDLPALQYTVQNASTTLALREAVEKLFQITWTLLAHCLEETAAQMKTTRGPIAPAPTAAPIVPAPAPTPVVAPRINPTDAMDAVMASLPLPAHLAPAAPTPIAVAPGLPSPTIEPGVTNVVITSQGTQVIAPTGARAILPPGSPVDLATSSGAAPELPPAPDGVDQVILPPGGGMTPELAAALAGRSNEQPPQ